MRLDLPIDPDPLRAVAPVADVPGTLLLHDGRSAANAGRSYLLFSPRWTLRREADGSVRIDGASAPALRLEGPPLRWPALLTRAWGPTRRRDDLPWLAGYLAHELGTEAQGGRHPRRPPFTLPDAWLAAYDVVVVFEAGRAPRMHVRDLGPFGSGAAPAARRAEAALELLRGDGPAVTGGATDPVTFLDPRWHRRSVDAIHEHLLRGDVYQINLTGFAHARTTVHPYDAFRREATTNPTEFAAYLRTSSATITSHSPELLLRRRGREVETRPIKGTAPTGFGRDLRASAKDRAEHVMIVDLCRHDLGRIARPGSVRVDPLMTALELRGLVHMVSHVRAHVAPGRGPDLLPALFPGGSVTGAPKRRACEILRDVERTGRGPYTGSIGAIAPSGSADWSVAIRTAVWQDGAVHFGCGGGIVLDSDSDREFEEARLKARSFFTTLGAEV